MCWVPAPHVRWVHHDDFAVILSLHTGEYYLLDGVAALVWQHLVDNSESGLRTAVEESYGAVPRDSQLNTDLASFIHTLVHTGLIERRFESPRPARSEKSPRTRRGLASGVPSYIACFISLAVVQISLRILGLRRLLRLLRVLPCIGSGTDAWPDAWVEQTANRFSRVAMFYPFGAQCLDQSVCLLWILRRGGRNAQLRIGVNPYPFSAHAWVEQAGRPLRHTSEYLAQYLPLQPIDIDQVG